MRAPTSWYAIGLAALGALVLASPTSAPTATTDALWQPQQKQRVLDLEVVYGDNVKSLFKSWNTDVRNINWIFPESTYTVSYVTPLPPAASSASVSWSSISDGSSATTMFLRFPEKQRADSGETIPTATPTSPTPTSTLSAATTSTPASIPSGTGVTTPTTATTVSSGTKVTTPSTENAASVPSGTEVTTATTAITFSSGTEVTTPTTATTASVPSGTEVTTPTTATTVASDTKVTTPTTVATASVSGKRPSIGRLADVCESCSLSDIGPSTSKFRCSCYGSIISGDLTDLLKNIDGVLQPIKDGYFTKSCTLISIKAPFSVRATCARVILVGKSVEYEMKETSINLGTNIDIVNSEKGGRQFAVVHSE